MLFLLVGCTPEPTVADSEAFYESQPEYLRPIPVSNIPDGIENIDAKTCGGCHQEIYQEWLLSSHSKAWMGDPQFQAELHKKREDGGTVSWMCVNCHTPNIQQLSQLVVGLDGGLQRPILIDNPLFDKQFQKDGVSCAGCHVRDGVILGPWGDSDCLLYTSPSPRDS